MFTLREEGFDVTDAAAASPPSGVPAADRFVGFSCRRAILPYGLPQVPPRVDHQKNALSRAPGPVPVTRCSRGVVDDGGCRQVGRPPQATSNLLTTGGLPDLNQPLL